MTTDVSLLADQPDWRQFATGLGEVQRDGDTVIIDLGNGRKHTVSVVLNEDTWELSGLVATASEAESVGVTPLQVWALNSQRCLTSFVVASSGDVWITALAPFAGLTAEEFCWLARAVASEADRLEYRLTGDDIW